MWDHLCHLESVENKQKSKFKMAAILWHRAHFAAHESSVSEILELFMML